MNKNKTNDIKLLGTLRNTDESGIIAYADQVFDPESESSVSERITKINEQAEQKLHVVQVDGYILAFVDSNNVFLGGIDRYGKWDIPRGIPAETKTILEQLQSALSKEVQTRSSLIDTHSSTYLWAITDSKGNIWLAGTADGKVVQPFGIPDEVKTALDKLDARVKSIESFIKLADVSGFLGAFIDAENNLLLDVRNDGTFDILSDLVSRKGYSLKVKDTVANTLYHIVDRQGKVLFNIRRDGKLVAGNGIIINGLSAGLSIIDTRGWLFAIVDNNHNVLGGIDDKGALFANSIRGIFTATIEQSYNYILAFKDRNGNVLFGITPSGEFVTEKVRIKGLPRVQESPEFLYVILDGQQKVLWGIFKSGAIYQPKGIPEEQKKWNQKADDAFKTLKECIADFHSGTGDWSNKDGCQIPIPRCAMVNLITATMPTAKSGMGVSGSNCDIPCFMEFWDRQGNYFKIPILLSAQGNSSMAFVKKNLAIDLFRDKDRQKSFTVKFGDWVAQDSYHLKAYYTDTFRGVGAVSYMLYEEMVKTRDLSDDRPYKYAFTKNYTMSDQGTADSNSNLDENFDTGAKCFPMGFPCVVLQNGEFYGLYSFQLKKHRDNMHQNKKIAEHIHLDGTLGATTIWNGVIDWTQFEVRNPKNLYMQEKQIIRGVETQEYNGDYPREIMGEDSAAYDKNNKNMKCCAKVKKYIQDLSERVPELIQAEKDGKTNDEMRTLIAKYFMPSFMVDYILETNLVSDGDGYNKNWQWTTWDGVLWVANPYDHDGIFGAYHIGNYVGSPSGGWLGNTTSIPSGWIIKYYMPELKARWAELRKAGIFDAKHIAKLLWSWCSRFGYDMWEKEYDKWNESPCYRPSLINSDYWMRVTGYINGWSVTTSYGKDAKVTKGGKVYNNLVANNIGIDPATDNGTNWEDITYNATKEYEANDICYYGSSIFYGFKALQACQGKPPLTGFYNLYPRELGHFDSVYRVENWLKQRITYMDKLLDYNQN